MGKRRGYQYLPDSLQGGYLSPATWWRGTKRLYNSVVAVATVAVTTSATATAAVLGSWITKTRNIYHDAYTDSYQEGTDAALAGKPYKINREADGGHYDDKWLEKPCTKYAPEPQDGIKGPLVGGGFGFIVASLTTASAVYALAFAAGHTKSLKQRIYFLIAAFACLGVEVSWHVIALFATGDIKNLAECLGYSNGYVEHCNTTISDKPPTRGSTVCDVPAKNDEYITLKTYGGNIQPAATAFTFFGDPLKAIPITVGAGAILIGAAFRNGQQIAMDKEERQLLETRMHGISA